MTKNKGIWIINGILIGLLVLILLFAFLGGWSTTIALLGEQEMTLEYGDQFQDPGSEATFKGSFLFAGGISIPVTSDVKQLEKAPPGAYTVTYSAGVFGAKGTVQRTVTVVDTTPPEISLVTEEGTYTKPGEAYEEEGYSAVDILDGDVTALVQRTEGEGTVTYTVTDASGNTASVTRQIRYDDPVAPVITLAGDSVMTMEKGAPFEEPGYTATDDCDGDITDRVTVEVLEDGVSYSVADNYGNVTVAFREITWVDTLAPALTLNGEGEITIKAGESFTDPGITALDQGDGDLSASVLVEGVVDIYHAGDYTLRYSVSDSAGNAASLTRTVHVEPRPQPDVVTPGDKVVYLTFDDGPGPYTRELLQILYQYNVKATFFVTGANPEYYDDIGLAASLGHSIGLHTYSHVYKSIYASEEAYFEDLNKIQAIVKEQTGSETTLMRFPGGSSNTASNFNPGIMTSLTEAVTDMGYQYFDWNVLSGDAGETTEATTVAWNVCSGMYKNNVSIVLQHDIKSYSVEAVEMILAWGIENGYTFLPLTETSPTAHHKVNN